jgi:3-oxoacyl-[acyl-carrier-protein] synthase III
MIRAKITGTGCFLPEKVLTNNDISRLVETSDEWITSRTGIRERRIASDGESTSDMAYGAAKMALENAHCAPAEIELIIVATLTPDNVFPSTACTVQAKFGIRGVPCFDLSAACTGFVYALTVAEQFVVTGKYKKVLVIGADAMSRVLDWTDRSTCILFGDGAGAVVVEPAAAGDDSGIIDSILAADGNFDEVLRLPGTGSIRDVFSNPRTVPRNFITMKGNELFKAVTRIVIKNILDLLEKTGHTPSQVDYLVPHQANLRIIDFICAKLQHPMEKVSSNMDRFGNTSASSIPISLHLDQTAGKIKKGDTILITGFGGGLTWGSMLLKW